MMSQGPSSALPEDVLMQRPNDLPVALDMVNNENVEEIDAVHDEVVTDRRKSFLSQSNDILGIGLSDAQETHSGDLLINDALPSFPESTFTLHDSLELGDTTLQFEVLGRCLSANSDWWKVSRDPGTPIRSATTDNNTTTESCSSAGVQNQSQNAAEGRHSHSGLHNNVYISELPQWNTEKLRSVCSAFGNIISAKVARDGATNRSLKYGFVMFETEEQALLCVNSLKNRAIEGRFLVARLAHEKAMPSFAQKDQLVPGTSFMTKPQGNSLLSHNQTAGNSPSTRAVFKGSNSSTTQASDPFLYQHGASGALKSCNVFLQGLPLHWNTDKLRSICGMYGKVQRAKVVRDTTTSLSSGHGFVLFEKEEQAAACVNALNRCTTEGCMLTCRLSREKKSTPPENSLSHHQGDFATSCPINPCTTSDGKAFTFPVGVMPPLPPPPPSSPPLFLETISFMPVNAYKPQMQQRVPAAVPYMSPETTIAPAGGAVQTTCPIAGLSYSMPMTKGENALPQNGLGFPYFSGHFVGSSVPSMAPLPGSYVVSMPYFQGS